MSDPIALSGQQRKHADRVGGVELMILWPAELGPEPPVLLDHEREATPSERAHAESLVHASCEAHGLVPVHTRVTRLRRPTASWSKTALALPAAGEERVHLAVTIIGRRWVHATKAGRGRIAWAQT